MKNNSKRSLSKKETNTNPTKRQRPLLRMQLEVNEDNADSDSSSSVEYRHHSILQVPRSPSSEPSIYDGLHSESPPPITADVSVPIRDKPTSRSPKRKDTPHATSKSKHSPAPLSPDGNYAKLREGKMFDTPFSAVAIVEDGIILSGSVWISVLRGTVDVLGASLTPLSQPSIIVSAPIAPFLVRIRPGKDTKNPRKREKKTFNPSHSAAEIHANMRGHLNKVVRDNHMYSTIVLFTKVDDRPIVNDDVLQTAPDISKSIRHYASTAGLPSVCSGAELVSGMAIVRDNGKTPVFQQWPEWKSVTSSIDSFLSTAGNRSIFRLLVCGSSGAGKSTFLRCITNHLLSNEKSVVLIDTDVGQPEMNPPGLVSAHLITDFRLGAAAASNRMVPIAARYLGEVTAREDPDLYARFVSEVTKAALKFANEHNCPIVINSCGWITGVGANLLTFLQSCAKPSHVALMQFPNSPPKHVLFDICARVPKDHVYDLISPYRTRNTAFSSKALRDLHIASYFSKELMLGRVYNVSADEMTVIPVGDSCENANLYSVVNATLVALATEQKDKNGEEKSWAVRGFGIVRAVDPENKIYFVTTPIPYNVLEGCTAMLISGGIQIPRALFLANAADSKSRSGDTPYICSGFIPSGEPMRSRATLLRR